ncbi:MAG TPA: sugar-binding domain-containing protein, partial [Cyclobacteriaceae bacterium]
MHQNKLIKILFVSNQHVRAALTVFVLLMSNVLTYSQLTNERMQPFDYDWKFFLGDTTTAKSKDFNDKSWRTFDLPHDWSIEGQVSPKNPTAGGGGYFPAGIGWYRKNFKAPIEWKGKKVSIYFEGVYMNSEVFINGKSLGVYPYGYSSFTYDLASRLEFGSENVIAVK